MEAMLPPPASTCALMARNTAPAWATKSPRCAGCPLVVVGDLSREEEDGLGARDLDALGVGRRIEDTGSAVPLDVGHENLLERRRVLGEYDDAAWVRSFLR